MYSFITPTFSTFFFPIVCCLLACFGRAFKMVYVLFNHAPGFAMWLAAKVCLGGAWCILASVVWGRCWDRDGGSRRVDLHRAPLSHLAPEVQRNVTFIVLYAWVLCEKWLTIQNFYFCLMLIEKCSLKMAVLIFSYFCLMLNEKGCLMRKALFHHLLFPY